MEKKYKFTGETITLENGTILKRIVCIKDFPSAKAGDIGGWIEKEKNLSHDGECWVFGDSRVYENAHVSQNAMVLSGTVYGNANISGNVAIYGTPSIYGNAYVYGNVQIAGNSKIYGDSVVCGDIAILGDTEIYGKAMVSGKTASYYDAEIFGNAHVNATMSVFKYASISSVSDIIQIGPIGSRSSTVTFYKNKTPKSISVSCGCFMDSIDKFEKEVKRNHSGTKHEAAYLAAINLAKIQILGGEYNGRKN